MGTSENGQLHDSCSLAVTVRNSADFSSSPSNPAEAAKILWEYEGQTCV